MIIQESSPTPNYCSQTSPSPPKKNKSQASAQDISPPINYYSNFIQTVTLYAYKLYSYVLLSQI